MADKTIYDLTENQSLDADDLFEQDVLQNNERKSLKTSLGAIAEKINTSLTYSGLNTTSKTITGAINELEAGGGGGTGGHTIIDENGNSMTARAGLQFVGGANVSDDSTNNKTIVDLASAGGIDGVFIDTSNLIKDDFTLDGTAYSWVATEDCILTGILIANGSSSAAYVSMDNDIFLFVTYESSMGSGLYLHVKKGQTIEYRGKTGSTMEAYGIQTGTTHSKFQPVIYSTEEREIGVWTYGKPLYQKSYIGLNVEITNVNTWYDTGLSASGVEVFVSGEMVDINNQSYPVNVAFMSSNTKIGISCGMANRTGVILTIRYTKTTDVAGSGSWTPQGVPAVHYSTDEQVIGTYLGETLYEKTFTYSTGFVSGNNNLSFDLSSNAIIRHYDIKAYSGSNPVVTIGEGNEIRTVNADWERIVVNIAQNTVPYVDEIIVTVQYTKSS